MKYVIVHDSFEETYVDFPDGVGHHYWDDRLGYQILSLKDLPSGSRVILITSGDCRIVPPIHNAYVSFLKLSGDGLSQAWKQQCLKVLWEMLQPRHPLHLNPCVYKLWRTPKFVTDNSLTTLAQYYVKSFVAPGQKTITLDRWKMHCKKRFDNHPGLTIMYLVFDANNRWLLDEVKGRHIYVANDKGEEDCLFIDDIDNNPPFPLPEGGHLKYNAMARQLPAPAPAVVGITLPTPISMNSVSTPSTIPHSELSHFGSASSVIIGRRNHGGFIVRRRIRAHNNNAFVGVRRNIADDYDSDW